MYTTVLAVSTILALLTAATVVSSNTNGCTTSLPLHMQRELASCVERVMAGQQVADDALHGAHQLVSLAPDCAPALHCAAIAEHRLVNRDAAIALMTRAVAADPAHLAAHVDLSLMLGEAGRATAAVEHLQALVQQHPGSALVAKALQAQLMAASGDRASAAEAGLAYLNRTASGLWRHSGPHEAVIFNTVHHLVTLHQPWRAARMLEQEVLRLEAAGKDATWAYIARSMVGSPNLPWSEADTERHEAAATAWRHAAQQRVEQRAAAGLPLPHSSTLGPAMGSLALVSMYRGGDMMPQRRAVAKLLTTAYPQLTRSSFQPRPLPDTAFPCRHSVCLAPFRPRSNHRRIRVAFVSAFFYRHSVAKMSLRLIAALPRHLFHVTLVSLGSGYNDEYLLALRTAADTFLQLAGNVQQVEETKQTLVEQDLDVIVYPELGMHRATYALACARLAPVQCTSHGNSLTSGLEDSIDYFVSFDGIETATAAAMYTEQLVRLQGVHSTFVHPAIVPGSLARPQALPTQWGNTQAQQQHSPSTSPTSSHDSLVDGAISALAVVVDFDRYGAEPLHTVLQDATASGWADAVPLPLLHNVELRHRLAAQQHKLAHFLCKDNVTWYLVPQSTFKYHPTMDGMLASILERDECGVVLLLSNHRRLAARIANSAMVRLERRTEALSSAAVAQAEAAAASMLHRTLMLQGDRDAASFAALLATVDVIVDSSPFGGCTTTYEALAVGTPVVTMPGQTLNARFSAALIVGIGEGALITHSLADFVERVVKVGRGMARARRAKEDSVRAQLVAKTRAMMMDEGPLHEWTRFLVRAAELALNQAAP